MRSEYDFGDSVESPYVRWPYGQGTMVLDDGAIRYIKRQGAESGMPYQTLINLHLSRCVSEEKKLALV